MIKFPFKSDRAAALTAFLLVILSVFLFFHGLFKGEVISTNDVGTSDLLYATFPVQALYGESLKRGEFLQWTPYIWGGFPVFAEGPYGFLYPIDLIVWYFFEPITAMNLAIILNPIIMGLGMYFFAKRLTNSAWTAIVPAVAASICGPMLVHARHYTASTAMALIPWLFYSVESFVSGKSKLLYSSLLYGAITGLMVLTGHPQYAFICVFITLVYFIIRFVIKTNNDILIPSKTKISLKEIIYFLLIAGIIAILIGFPQLKETFTLVKFSQRSTEDLGEGFTGMGSLSWNGFLTFIYPYYMGDASDATFKSQEVYLFWEYFHYAGLSIFILALVGVYWGWGKSNSVKSLVIIGTLFYLMALGTNFPIYKVFSMFPLLKSFRFQVRWLLGTEIAVIGLSGFGLYAISTFFYKNNRRDVEKSSSKQKSSGNPKRKTAVIQKIVSPSPLVVLITSLVVLTDIYIVAGRQVKTSDPAIYLSPTAVIKKIQTENNGKQYSLGSSEFFRGIYSHSHGWDGDKSMYRLAVNMLPPHLPALFHIPVIYGYTALVPNYIYEVWGDATHNGIIQTTASVNPNNLFQPKETFTKLCKMWGVKYFTSIWKMPDPFVKIWDSLGVFAYELPEVFPRAWVVHKIENISPNNIQKEAQKLLDNNFNPLEEAICSGDLPALPPDAKNGMAEILAWDNHSIKIKANEPGLVVLSDTWYPKWKATIDGKEIPVYRVNCSMRGIVSPQSGSIIEMHYDTDSVLLFAIISYIALFCSLGCSIWGTRIKN